MNLLNRLSLTRSRESPIKIHLRLKSITMSNGGTEPTVPEGGRFDKTHWTVVLAAAKNDAQSLQAWNELCLVYWKPLYAFVRHQGFSPEDAHDLTQGFFAHLLGHNGLAKVDPAKGKFRSFLLACLRNFLANARNYLEAKKRGGGCVTIPLDPAAAETWFCTLPANNDSPDKIFERNWVLALMEDVLTHLRTEQQAAGKGAQFEKLGPALMCDPDAPHSKTLAADLGITVHAVKMAVHRLRGRYRELLRETILPMVESPSEVDAEIKYLFSVLSR